MTFYVYDYPQKLVTIKVASLSHGFQCIDHRFPDEIEESIVKQCFQLKLGLECEQQWAKETIKGLKESESVSKEVQDLQNVQKISETAQAVLPPQIVSPKPSIEMNLSIFDKSLDQEAFPVSSEETQTAGQSISRLSSPAPDSPLQELNENVALSTIACRQLNSP
ncbi:MAG: hypothetical protein ACHQUC_09830 [Chlamydiales bacterium]